MQPIQGWLVRRRHDCCSVEGSRGCRRCFNFQAVPSNLGRPEGYCTDLLVASKPERLRSPGGAWRKSGYWPHGVRGTGGVTLALALVGNLRISPAVIREKAQAAASRGRKYQFAGQGANRPVVARNRGNARGA